MEERWVSAETRGSGDESFPRTEIDTTPLGMPAAGFCDKGLSTNGPRCLTIGPNRASYTFSCAFAGVGAAVLAAGLLSPTDAGRPIVAYVAGGLFLLVGLAMAAASRRFVFDLEEQTLRERSLLKDESRPLREILAVQTIEGGYHSSSGGGGYSTYQLNLVLAGERPRRLGLTNHSDRDWTAETGVRLAEFLGVPLLGTLAVRDAAEKARVVRRDRRLLRRIAAGMVGAFVGFFGGFVAFVAWMIHRGMEFDAVVRAFPACLVAGLFLGAALGVCIDVRLSRWARGRGRAHPAAGE